jgi:hypothetical protein
MCNVQHSFPLQNIVFIAHRSPLTFSLAFSTPSVCLQPDANTKNQDVSILKLNNFKYFMPREGLKTLSQEAVDAGAASQRTILECPGGEDKPCSFRTQLRENFFYQDGQVEGVGSVALQYNAGADRRLRTAIHNVPVVTVTASGVPRQAQEFAGLVGVNMFFDIEDGFDKKKIKEARQNFKEHWNEQPAHVQGLYITGVLLLLLLLCCCCGGMILWRHCCADIPGNWVRRTRDQDEIHVMPPMGVDGKSTQDGDDPSETYSLEEDDLMAEEEDEEYSSDEEDSQQPPPSYISRQLEDETSSASPSVFTQSHTTMTDERGIVPYAENGSETKR